MEPKPNQMERTKSNAEKMCSGGGGISWGVCAGVCVCERGIGLQKVCELGPYIMCVDVVIFHGGVHDVFNETHPFVVHVGDAVAQQEAKKMLHDVARIHVPARTHFVEGSHGGMSAHDVPHHGIEEGWTDAFEGVGGGAVGLEEVDHAADVGLEEGLDGFEFGAGKVQAFLRDNALEEAQDVIFRQLVEAEAHEFVLQSFVNFADVVANEAEAYVGKAVLQQQSQGLLRALGHVVDFVQDDEFGAALEQSLGVHEGHDLVANDVDAAFVGGVQVDDEIVVVDAVSRVESVDEVDDGRGFARSWRPVEQEIRELVGFDHPPQNGAVERVQHNLVEGLWTILFRPHVPFAPRVVLLLLLDSLLLGRYHSNLFAQGSDGGHWIGAKK